MRPGDLCGFCIVIIAVILLNAFQHAEISLGDLQQMMRPRRDPINQKSPSHEAVFVRQPHRNNNYGTRNYDTDFVRKL